jgi:uncharacterized paraquat-inducible protein A
MPYVICARCALTTYSAALWSSTDECPRCGSTLPVSDRATAIELARRAGLLPLADVSVHPRPQARPDGR